ncbi:hypothetical protein FRB90_004022 [Tulasnella sp. 427]|nr:hypothetical protein FRB90_004022 [Tulasnella sp. 427]
METFLSQIQAESAMELLTRVRRQTDPPGATFITQLDSHIASANPDSLVGDSTLSHGDVIEIQGPAASGKTQLLHFFAMTCVLPPVASITCTATSQETLASAESSGSSRDIALGGRGKAVMILDCDGRWSMLRLHRIIESLLSVKFSEAFADMQIQLSRIPNLTLLFTPSPADVAKQCLKRAHLFRPTSSMSLATTLLALPAYHKQKMPDQDMLMVFIDSISAFHHADKWAIEEANLASRAKSGANKTAPVPPRTDLRAMTHITNAIQALQRTHGVITLITNWALITPDGKSVNNYIYDNNRPFYGQHLLAPYPQPPGQVHPHARQVVSVPTNSSFAVTHHITLPGTEFAILPFPAGTSFADALQDEERRAVVEDQRVTALVRTFRTPTDGSPPTEVAVGSFEFAIQDRSVIVD